jgi:hypothetical protein
LENFGNFLRITSANFGIFKLEFVEILGKWIFQFGLGLSPVLQYQPKPTRTAGPSAIFPYARAPGHHSDCAVIGSDCASCSCTPCHLPSRPPRAGHAAPPCVPVSAVLIPCLVFGEKQSLLKSPTPSPSHAPLLCRRRRSSAPHYRTPPT